MKLSGDLSTKWIYIKGALFLAILIVSSVLLVLADEIVQRILLVPLLIWSSARFYYFMFYVIEHYVDPGYKFSGIGSFLKFIINRRNH